MEIIKIWLLSIAAAILYGILHDQVTARVCLEYFTVFHPPVFDTTSPTLLALGWGGLLPGGWGQRYPNQPRRNESEEQPGRTCPYEESVV
jgi:hypothetical protein